MNELTRYNSIQLNSLEDAMRVAMILAQSGYFKDSKNESQAVAKILAGNELGIPPVAALQGILLVDGKLSLSAALCGSLVKRSGKYNYIVSSHDETHCSIDFYEQWGNESKVIGTSTFSMADAQRAGLAHKTNWKNWPKAMLFARAITQGSRWFCPDIFSGAVYAPEELNPDVPVDENGEIIEVKPVRAMTISPSPVDPQCNDLIQKTTRLIEAIATESKQERDSVTDDLKQWADAKGFPRARAAMTLEQLGTLHQHLEELLKSAIISNDADAPTIPILFDTP